MASSDQTGGIGPAEGRAPGAHGRNRALKAAGLAIVAALVWVATCAALTHAGGGEAVAVRTGSTQTPPRQDAPAQDLTASPEESPFPPAAPEDVGLTHEQLNALSSLTARWVDGRPDRVRRGADREEPADRAVAGPIVKARTGG